LKTLDLAVVMEMANLFRSFESDLDSLVVDEALDPTTQNALGVLGYTP
jgi:hypothetical protein